MNTTLLDAVRALHAARMTVADRTRQLAERKAAFDAENAALIRHLLDAKTDAEAADRAVRALADAQYDATGATKPGPGVTVVVTNTMDYDPDEALAWAKEKQLALVPEALDPAAFAKIAKATPLPFVTYGTTTSVRIASDLASALASVADPADAADDVEDVSHLFEPPF